MSFQENRKIPLHESQPKLYIVVVFFYNKRCCMEAKQTVELQCGVTIKKHVFQIFRFFSFIGLYSLLVGRYLDTWSSAYCDTYILDI